MPSVSRSLEFGTLEAKDIPAAVRLSRRVGWNTVECDWRRLHTNPNTTVLTGTIDGELVGTVSIVCYAGTLRWLGMLLVDPSRQGNDYRRTLFRRAVERATESETHVGIDADHGRYSLYADHGFVAVTPIERRQGTLPDGPMPGSARPITAAEHNTVLAFDRAETGHDRGPVLRQLLTETATTGAIVVDDTIEGYAIVRPGRERLHLGPIVATTTDALERLLTAIGTILEGTPIVTDVIPTAGTTAVFDALGIDCDRTLTRMSYRESRPMLTEEPIRSSIGIEWG